MDLRERIVFVDERHPVAVFLENLRKQRVVHARAKRAFEIVEVDHHDLGRLWLRATGRPLTSILLMVSAKGSLLKSNLVTRSMVLRSLRNQKLVVLALAIAAVDVDGDGVISGHVAGRRNGTDDHLYFCGNGVERAHLVLDLASHIRRSGLGHAAQANQQQNEKRTSN